jgi:hypothetical protein
MGAGHGTNVLTHGNLPVVSEAAFPMLQKTPDQFGLGLTPLHFEALENETLGEKRNVEKVPRLRTGVSHIERKGVYVCVSGSPEPEIGPPHLWMLARGRGASTSSGHWFHQTETLDAGREQT